jgi:hypothetical protein
MASSLFDFTEAKKSKSLLPALIVGSIALSGVSIALHVMTLGTVFSVANKPVPNLVETADGSILSVEAMKPGEHSGEAIQEWVADTMFGLYDWRGFLPPKSQEEVGRPQRDPGNPIKLEGSRTRRVASSTWNYAWRLSEDLRPQYLRKMAAITPTAVFENPQSFRASLVTREVIPPERIGENQWKVRYHGFMVIFEGGDNVGSSFPVNKILYLRDIDTSPLRPSATETQQIIHKMREAELEIYQIQDIQYAE